MQNAIFHLLEGSHLDLANALARDAELDGEVFQCDRLDLFHHAASRRSAARGACMIYDVRQSTTYHYASPVAVAHHMLRLTPIDRRRLAVIPLGPNSALRLAERAALGARS